LVRLRRPQPAIEVTFSPRQEVGRRAEQRAADHLISHGLELVLANYRCRFGELDLVMRDGPTLAVVEVRQRAAAQFGGAAASVTRGKQRRIVLATRHLLLTHAALRTLPVRFDVVTLEPAPAGMRIEWLRDAFRV
jgi:putative endonuclease